MKTRRCLPRGEISGKSSPTVRTRRKPVGAAQVNTERRALEQHPDDERFLIDRELTVHRYELPDPAEPGGTRA